jgi:hypothetical protein
LLIFIALHQLSHFDRSSLPANTPFAGKTARPLPRYAATVSAQPFSSLAHFAPPLNAAAICTPQHVLAPTAGRRYRFIDVYRQ